MKVSAHGREFIEGFEAFVPYVYDDKLAPVHGKYVEWTGGPVKGTLTIGFGHTNAAKHPLKITPGLRITREQGDEILSVDLAECEASVSRLVKLALTQGQFDALVSFTFNCGAGTLAKSTLLRKLNKGDYAGARAAFDLYVMSRGEKMRGLQRRRDGEQDLWDEGVAKAPTGEPIYHTADVDEPKPAKELYKSKEATGGLATAAGGVYLAADQVNNAAELAKRTNDNINEVIPILTGLLHMPGFWVALAVVTLGVGIFFWRRKHHLEDLI